MNWEERLSELRKTREENGPVRHDYECDICRDALFTFREDGTAVRCICLVKKINRQHLKNMGLNTDLMSLDRFREDTPTARFLKNKAVKYLKDFPASMLLAGQPGSGKTHITTAVLKELIEKHGIKVHYTSYLKEMTELKGIRYSDTEEYTKRISRMKTVGILVIDDFFKGGPPTRADIEIIFDIINERYINSRPVIINTELYPDEILQVDEALGSRITEMCGEYVVTITRDKSKNRRLKTGSVI